jgi:NAD(P)-dependent dehydrogenase (short-subunit alcohol dehydrogenase family)
MVRNLASLGVHIDHLLHAAADLRFLGPISDSMLYAIEARRQLDVNVIAPAVLCSALFQYHWKNVPVAEQQASVVLVSSLSGTSVFPDTGQAIYAASKAALNALTLHMAAEFGSYGIRVNGLGPNAFPAIIKTEIVAKAALRLLKEPTTGKIYNLG